MMHNPLEMEILKLLTKLRASGHAINVDGLGLSIQAENPEIDLKEIKDRIHVHIQRLRGPGPH